MFVIIMISKDTKKKLSLNLLQFSNLYLIFDFDK
jgi:hypothetical protein